MDLIFEKVKQNIDKVKCYDSFTFDSDYVIKDNRMDVGKVVCHNAKIKNDEYKLIGDAVWVSGSIEFEVVYVTDEENGQVESISDSFAFQEKVDADGVLEDDELRLYLKIEDMNISIINSRKLSIRGEIKSELYAKKEVEIGYPLKMSDESIMQLYEEIPVMDMVCDVKDIIRVRKEIVLPKTKSNKYKLLYSVADIRNLEYSRKTEGIETTGEIDIFIIYQSEEQELCYFETVENFCELLKLDNRDGDIDWIRFDTINYQIEAENDYDGEPRQLFVEMSLSMDGKIWKQRNLNVLADLYALDKKISPVKQEICMNKLKMKNISKCRVMSQFEKTKSDRNIFHVCSSMADVFIENIKSVENGVVVSGILAVKTISVVDNDSCSIEKQEEKIEFEQYVELGIVTNNTYIEVCGKVDQLQVNLLEAKEYEVKAVISIEVLAMETEHRKIIVDIEQEDRIFEENTPGIVGYIMQKNEKLWDVAKKYNTTIESIMEINELNSESVNENQRIIIARESKIC